MDTLHTFHIWKNGQSTGPFTVGALQDMLKKGTLSRESLVARVGDEEWLPLSTYADVIDPPRREPVKAPEPAPALKNDDAPLTAVMVQEWLLRAAFAFVVIGVVTVMLAAAVYGLPGLWFCVGPLSLALTLAIVAWAKP